MDGSDVTVVTPSLPERIEWLERAVRSVAGQFAQPADHVVHVDHDREGTWVARNAALEKVSTEWVAFLDDDDWFHRDHLQKLVDGANRSGADLISTYPQCDTGRAFRRDALKCCYKGILVRGPINIPWGPDQIDHLDSRRGRICPHCGTKRGNFVCVTNLVRMDLVDKVGGFPEPFSMGDDFAGYGGEDYLFLLKLLDVGARFHHVTGVRTWTFGADAPNRSLARITAEVAARRGITE